MNRRQASRYFVGVLTLLASLLAYLELSSLGFPDGHRTGFERAEEVLLRIFVPVSLLAAGWSFYLGRLTSRRNVDRGFRTAVIAYLAFSTMLLALAIYCRRTLEHGGGG